MLLAAATHAAEAGPQARQLARECELLLASAVKRPYGWAWEADAAAAASQPARAAPRHVIMEPPGTAAAGLILLSAGDLLREPRYRDAAVQAARAISASQNITGQIPRTAVFGTSSGGRDAPAIVPDRAATRAGILLLLAIAEREPEQAEVFKRNAQRAARWLTKQQATDGGWPVAHPPDASPPDAQRLLMLDQAEYRDSTLAMLLIADALPEQMFSRAAANSVDKLLGLTLANYVGQQPTTDAVAAVLVDAPDKRDARLAPLWSTAYRLNGAIDDRLTEFPAGADVVASRFAVQTLLATYLITGRDDAMAAADAAARSLEELRGEQSQWRRMYLVAGPTTAPAATQPLGMFDPPPPPERPWVTGDFELEPTLRWVAQVRELGRQEYVARLSTAAPLKDHMTAIVCRLQEPPLKLESDSNPPREIPRGADLAKRLPAMWSLVQRTRIEVGPAATPPSK